MKKSQTVYRYLAEAALKDKNAGFAMRDMARALHISPNTVSLAIKPLERVGAVSRRSNRAGVLDLEKLMAFWAVSRNLEKDIIYRTYVDERETEIEKRMPSEIAFTCYSAYSMLFGNDASDYSGVYAYATEKGLEQIMKRFPEKRLSGKSGYSNLIVLKPDQVLEEMINTGTLKRSSVSVPQIYVDLWNNKDWYANEFLKKLKVRMDEMYAKAIL